MNLNRERIELEAELEAYFASWPHDLTPLLGELQSEVNAHPEWSPLRCKAAGYEFFAERLPIAVFRNSPFYFQIDTGRERADLCFGGVTMWMKQTPPNLALIALADEWQAPCNQSGLSVTWQLTDDNHHALNYEALLRDGINGTRQRVQQRLERDDVTAGEREFLETMLVGLGALVTLANRFADEAEHMAAQEQDEDVIARLRLLAQTARRVPAEPPATFYEALCALLFMREAVQWLEGSGISILGHYDRLLNPYYEADLAAGRLTREEAAYWLGHSLSLSDFRFGMRSANGFHAGTNGTVVLGGCERDGTPIFNEVTRLVVEMFAQLHLIDPKLNIRIGATHPEACFALFARAIADCNNAVAIFNDDVIIPANVRQGKAPEDARLYVGGGCQENVLDGTEVNNRATIYLNAVRVLLMGFEPRQWDDFAAREDFTIASYLDAPDFDGVYQAFLSNLHNAAVAHARQRTRTEAVPSFNPCPLHSAFIADCIDNAKDMMLGGARYNFSSVGLCGIGTVIDSLLAIKHLVFVEHRLTLSELADVLEHNFEDEEMLRQYVINRLPRFGKTDEESLSFSAQVFHDAAVVTSGMPNARGGVYEPSLFPFRLFISLGSRTGATPDGRHAHDELSPGMSPSILTMGKECELPQILESLQPIDMTDYPVVAVLDVKLPPLPDEGKEPILSSVIHRFLQVGGSVLQTNYVRQEELLDARVHPERHRDLIVRVSGYSSYFTVLDESIQDEIIARTTAHT